MRKKLVLASAFFLGLIACAAVAACSGNDDSTGGRGLPTTVIDSGVPIDTAVGDSGDQDDAQPVDTGEFVFENEPVIEALSTFVGARDLEVERRDLGDAWAEAFVSRCDLFVARHDGVDSRPHLRIVRSDLDIVAADPIQGIQGGIDGDEEEQEEIGCARERDAAR